MHSLTPSFSQSGSKCARAATRTAASRTAASRTNVLAKTGRVNGSTVRVQAGKATHCFWQAYATMAAV